MKKILSCGATALALLLIGTSVGSADVVYIGPTQADFGTGNETGFAATTAPTAASGVTASLFTNDVDDTNTIRSSFGAPVFASNIFAANFGDAVDIANAAAADTNLSLLFTLTAQNPGDVLTLGDLEFNFGLASNNTDPVTNSVGYIVGVSTTGPTGIFTDAAVVDQSISLGARSATSFSLSAVPAIDLSGFSGASSATIRITPSHSGASSEAVLLSNISLAASAAAVPEPSSLALLLFAGAAAFGRRRRRQ